MFRGCSKYVPTMFQAYLDCQGSCGAGAGTVPEHVWHTSKTMHYLLEHGGTHYFLKVGGIMALSGLNPGDYAGSGAVSPWLGSPDTGEPYSLEPIGHLCL